jgi:hypothetical protein
MGACVREQQIPDHRMAEFLHLSAMCVCQTGAHAPKARNLDADFEP